MNQALTHICPFCGSGTATTSNQCTRCRADLAKQIAAGSLSRAYDVTPTVVFKRKVTHYQQRPAEMLAILEERRVPLSRMKLAIDVGCGPNILGQQLRAKYPSLETAGWDGDVRDAERNIHPIELENAKLPYAEGEVDLAVCCHVLEHVDHAHDLADELFRVGRYVLIVLPNSLLWTTLAKVALKRSILPMLGLPIARPVDRHRWLYAMSEAEAWMRHCAGKFGRELYVEYRTDERVPALAGRLNKELFALEAYYLFSPGK